MDKFDTQSLINFLYEAKGNTFASGVQSQENSQLSGRNEFRFSNKEFEYVDRYAGEVHFIGMEEVRPVSAEIEMEQPIWAMVYSGGMLPRFNNNPVLMRQTYTFLRKALLRLPQDSPFRGPVLFPRTPAEIKENPLFAYQNHVDGNIKRFSGYETIAYKGNKSYTLDYAGGLII